MSLGWTLFGGHSSTTYITTAVGKDPIFHGILPSLLIRLVGMMLQLEILQF